MDRWWWWVKNWEESPSSTTCKVQVFQTAHQSPYYLITHLQTIVIWHTFTHTHFASLVPDAFIFNVNKVHTNTLKTVTLFCFLIKNTGTGKKRHINYYHYVNLYSSISLLFVTPFTTFIFFLFLLLSLLYPGTALLFWPNSWFKRTLILIFFLFSVFPLPFIFLLHKLHTFFFLLFFPLSTVHIFDTHTTFNRTPLNFLTKRAHKLFLFFFFFFI